MAQNEGKKFEEDWKKSFAKLNAYYFRIKDSAASFSGGNTSFTRTNPYDCFVLYEGFFLPMELKSTKGTSFSFDKEGAGNGNKLIKLSQIHGLNEVSQFKNAKAGFIFNFRDVHRTYYLDIVNFMNFYNNTSKFSINEKDIVEYEGVLIESKLLKVRYRYNVEKLLNELIRG